MRIRQNITCKVEHMNMYVCVGGISGNGIYTWNQSIWLLKSQVIPTLYLNVCICICVCLGTLVPGHNLARLDII